MQFPKSSIRESHSPSIAIDFGGTKIAAARIVDYEIVERMQIATDQKASPEAQVATIIRLIEGLRDTDQTHIGVAVTGRVDHDGRWHTLNQETFSGLTAYPLTRKLETHFNASVTVMNDAVAAAWGEFQAYPEHDKKHSLLYITVSTGVGGGLVLNGQPLQSLNGLAGHIGFMSSQLEQVTGRTGSKGTLESIASGTAIARAANQGKDPAITCKEVFKKHLANNPDATTIINTSAKALARTIADVRSLLDVELVVIGGSVGLADGYLDLVKEHIQIEPEIFQPTLLSAQLGADSALFGVSWFRCL